MIRNGFVINPYKELLPDFKICPFSNSDLYKNRLLPISNSIDDYFSAKFSNKHYIYTLNGREAISIALEYYQLQPEDVVTILTTSGNLYISSCVTSEIEKFCKWSREISPNTRVIFVNHEFGYPYEELIDLKKYNLPIIEDCAHTFFSCDMHNTIGTIGDFIIYSFPKMFPIQFGGLLVNNLNTSRVKSTLLDRVEKRYIKNVISYYIQIKDEIMEKRIKNYSYLSNEFKKLGLTERFKLAEGIIPGAFIFRIGINKIELPKLKTFFYAHGIQSSVFYGEESFFIPVHHKLTKLDLTYFTEIMKSAIKPQ